MLKPHLFLWAEWEQIILHSTARNALRFAVLGLQTCYCQELWSLEQCFMFCVMGVWFFIRKSLSSYWSMFRNTACSYGNQREFCPCLQIEQEQTPCLQHQTSWHKVRKLGGPAKLHWCGKVSLQIKRLQERRAGLSLPYPQRTSQTHSLASSPCTARRSCQPVPQLKGKGRAAAAAASHG